MSRGFHTRLAVMLGLAYLTLTSAAGVYLADGIVHPGRASLTEAERQAAARLAAARDANLEDVEVVASDGTHLRAWLFSPAAANGHSVLVLHGQASNRAGMWEVPGIAPRSA